MLSREFQKLGYSHVALVFVTCPPDYTSSLAFSSPPWCLHNSTSTFLWSISLRCNSSLPAFLPNGSQGLLGTNCTYNECTMNYIPSIFSLIFRTFHSWLPIIYLPIINLSYPPIHTSPKLECWCTLSPGMFAPHLLSVGILSTYVKILFYHSVSILTFHCLILWPWRLLWTALTNHAFPLAYDWVWQWGGPIGYGRHQQETDWFPGFYK